MKKENLYGEKVITEEHVKNNIDVRHVLAKSNIYVEELLAEEDIKKVEKKLKNQDPTGNPLKTTH